MIRCDPMLIESVAGLVLTVRAYRAQLGYLLLQAVVLLCMWPKSGLLELVGRRQEPDALLGLLICVGMTQAYAAVREGGEELIGAEQASLREWAVSTSLGLSGIVAGQVLAQLLHSLYALLLSLPLIVIAYTVSAAHPLTVLCCLLAAVIQALFYRLLAASVFLWIGHRRELMFYASRTVLVLGYALGLLALGSMSHPMLTYGLLRAGTAAPAMPAAYFLVYGAILVLLGLLLISQLRPYREAQSVGTAHER